MLEHHATIPLFLQDVYQEDREIGRYLDEAYPRTQAEAKQKLALIFQDLIESSRIAQVLGYPSALRIIEEDIPDVISSVDHMGVLSFPPFINSNILYGAWLKHINPSTRFQWVLSCTGVPLNNASFPRGIFLAGHKIPLFRRKSERWCSSHVPGGHMRVPDHHAFAQWPHVYETLRSWSAHVQRFGLQHSHEEMCVLNNYVWKTYAPDLRLELMTLSGEDVFTAWLARGYGSWFESFLFEWDGATRRDINSHFDGCPGAWCSRSGRGTHLFWDVSEPGRERAPMMLDRKGRTLQSDRFELPLEKERVCVALYKKQILPSLFTFFGLLSFDGGVVMAGGFNQLEYLSEMNERFEKLARREVIPAFYPMTRPKALCGFPVSQARGIEFLFGTRLSQLHARDILRYRLGDLLS